MLKILVTFYLNIALILAANTTLYQTPEAYIEWKIKNFFDLPTEINYSLNSTTFSIANIKWYLKIFPNGQTSHVSDGYIGVYLGNVVYVEKKYKVNFTLGFKKQDGSEFETKPATHTFNDKYLYWGFPKFIEKSKLLRLKDTVVPAGTLTVLCRARFVKSIEVIPQVSSSPELDSSQNVLICNQSNSLINESLPISRTSSNTTQCTETLSDNLKNLYTSKRFTDVTITCNNTEFSAHKIILSYRVPAFGSMLEKNPNKIEIADCDPESFEEFLRFIYTAKLVNISTKKATSLYLLADKFNIYELKEECARYIAKHVLNIDTFYDILRFANLHSDSMLLMATTEFFITNAKLILSTEKWEKFHSDDPPQVNKLFLAYVDKKN